MAKKIAVAKGYLAKIRNIGIIAHIDAGKTTLTERMLYYSGRIHRMGEVHEGTATMDFMPEEQERGITIGSAMTTAQWRDCQINIVDTPGHVDFTIEVERSLRVLDGAVGVFCAVGGVEPQSETVWRQSETYGVPKIAFVNKMDRLGADFEAVLQSMRDKLKANALAVQIPVGAGAEFEAVIDLVDMKKLVFDQGTQGEEFQALDLEPDELDLAEPWREAMMEALSELDDEFMERYLGGEDISEKDIRAALRGATLSREIVPVLVGSALKNIGVQPVMDAVLDLLPTPQDVGAVEGEDPETREKKSFSPDHKSRPAALVFKVSMESGRKMAIMRIYSGKIEAGEVMYNSTQDKDDRVARLFKLHAGRKEKVDYALAGEIVAAAGVKFARTGDTLCSRDDAVVLEQISGYKPVISIAVEPRGADEEERLQEVLGKYLMEDPTLAFEQDEETGQFILSGMGELHLDVILERMRREYNLSPRAGKPQVVYQETVGAKAEAEEEFNRELGEDLHFGKVRLAVEPLGRDQGRDVKFEINPDEWPSQWMDAVAEGIDDGLQSGVIKGYPVQDVRVRVTGLERMDGQSSPVGYHMAANMALKKALGQASPLLLEPIMWVEIAVPDEFVGDVVGLLGSKGAKIENMFDASGRKTVQALAPLASLFGFSTDLRSSTQGRAGFVMKFSRFDVLD